MVVLLINNPNSRGELNFGPKSLSNTDYNMLAMVIFKRLALFIGKMIGNEQTSADAKYLQHLLNSVLVHSSFSEGCFIDKITVLTRAQTKKGTLCMECQQALVDSCRMARVIDAGSTMEFYKGLVIRRSDDVHRESLFIQSGINWSFPGQDMWVISRNH